jgi:hypothetical protein
MGCRKQMVSRSEGGYVTSEINEIRIIRRNISEEFEHNPKQYIAYLKKIRGNYITQISLYDEMFNNNVQLTDVTHRLD